MKRIIITVVLIALIASCAVTPPADPPVLHTPDDTSQPPTTPPTSGPGTEPPAVSVTDVVFATYDGATLRYYDGVQLHDAYVGHIREADLRTLSIEDVLYYFDESGDPVDSKWLPVVPDAVLVAKSTAQTPATSRAIAYEDEVWTLETIPAEEAYALGALPRAYTRVFRDGVEQGLWYMNEWEVGEIIQPLSGHIIVKTVAGHYINFTDNKTINLAMHGGLLLYDMGTEEGYIADDSGEYYVTWSMNWFDHSVWQKANGVWYTENGYTWTPQTGVVSNANAMYVWNDRDNYPSSYTGDYGEAPFLLPAGVLTENGEEVTYWIETVSGNLYRHIPSVDRLDFIVMLYEGPGNRTEAAMYRNTLSPDVIDGYLYYHLEGTLMRYNFSTGLVSVFSSDQEVISWN